ncbi:Pectinesterase [Macleaya cordata]|uniref:Pectinesterase n=1 Tax=Macleaya cordata TaxID=56857 RepID=A0A200PZQ2_MACCD|nr:Pectinesterase [Macleaya cordata]
MGMSIIKSWVAFITTLLVWALVIGSSPIFSWGLAADGHDINQEETRAHADQLEKENVQRKLCSLTRYPNLCTKTLLGLGHINNDHDDIVSALVQKTRDETSNQIGILSNTSYQLDQSLLLEGQHNAPAILGYCCELMNMSLKRLSQSILALKKSPTKHKRDIQTWLSAVLTFQMTCKDSINSALSGSLGRQYSNKMNYLSRLASNSLALVNAIHGEPKNATSRRLTTEQQVFPAEWVSRKDRKLLQTSSTVIQANAVVAKDGSGDFETISDAIEAASGGRFVIYVKSGMYKEKIHTNKDGITLIGDGKYSTIIYNDASAAGGSSMPGSATFAITGDRFIARDIGFQNTAGPKGDQALALNVASDRSVFYRCSIAGYQDTLYALALRQFYRECDIYGTIDFIFGNALAVFQNCDLVLRRPQSGGFNVILANGREDPSQDTGFSIQKCRIVAGSDLASVKHSVESYLGRPWKKYSRSVIMQSTIDDVIKPRGWIEWSGNFALNTLYFAEYLNSGPGSGTASRVKWPGYHEIGPKEAVKFTVGEFIGGTEWLPSTGVTFVAGL